MSDASCATSKRILQIHPDDDLIVALDDLQADERVWLEQQSYLLLESIPAKHKFAGRDILPGERCTMYGVTVGEAACAIPCGARITVKNLRHNSDAYQLESSDYQWQAPDISGWQGQTFNGYLRANGEAGTANYWLVVPLVFCQNRNIELLQAALQDNLGYSRFDDYQQLTRQLLGQYSEQYQGEAEQSRTRLKVFPNVDGVKFVTHTAGCGGTREDAQSLCRLLAGYIHHPNVAGATVLSLGCQNAQMSLLQAELERLDPQGQTPVLWFEQQQYGSEQTMMAAAIEQTLAGLAQANQCQRQPLPLSKLRIGVECGGSDGFSGLSANPLIGRVADHLVALGGSAILAEFPELCGVEQEILNRCRSDALRQRFSELMQAYQRQALAVGASFDMNPSPGNIRDGLITDAMKSAGAALKGGSAPVVDVLDYTEVCQQQGLSLLCTPGNDVESTTALAASGANLVLFSTGLGTPTGNPVVPVLKVSSNSSLARRMQDIIDFDAGPVISGEQSLDQLADQLLALCCKTASGEYQSKAQTLGQDDFIPWKRGVSL